jgi:hypothetical protein
MVKKGRNWHEPQQPRTLDLRAAYLPRASQGAQPVSRAQKRGACQDPVPQAAWGCSYLDLFRFWRWERLDEIFDLFSLLHEVVYEFSLVR